MAPPLGFYNTYCISSIPYCVCKSYSSRALCWHIYDVHEISPQARLRCAIYRVIYFLQNFSLNHSLIQSSNMWNLHKEVSWKIFFCHVTPFHYQANGALAVSGYLIKGTRGLSTFRKIIYSITEIYLYVSGHIWIERSDLKNSTPHLDTIKMIWKWLLSLTCLTSLLFRKNDRWGLSLEKPQVSQYFYPISNLVSFCESRNFPFLSTSISVAFFICLRV